MKTKEDLLLTVLKERPNEFVDLPYLAAVVGSFDIRTRAARLREQGFSIENKIEYEGRTRHSFYRLVLDGVSRQGVTVEEIREFARHG